MEKLTINQKIQSVIDDYNDIASQYAADFYDDATDNVYIDKFSKYPKKMQIMYKIVCIIWYV